jgi:hypothetical protein
MVTTWIDPVEEQISKLRTTLVRLRSGDRVGSSDRCATDEETQALIRTVEGIIAQLESVRPSVRTRPQGRALPRGVAR